MPVQGGEEDVAFCNWGSRTSSVPIHSGEEGVLSWSWENGAKSSATGVRISKPSGVRGLGAGKVMLADMTDKYLMNGHTCEILLERRSRSMTLDLLPNPRCWDDFLIDVDIAFFPYPLSLCNFMPDDFPVIFFSIFAHVPVFESPLILCFAERESVYATQCSLMIQTSVPFCKPMGSCHSVSEASRAFKPEVVFHIQRFDCSLVTIPFRVSLVTGSHVEGKAESGSEHNENFG